MINKARALNNITAGVHDLMKAQHQETGNAIAGALADKASEIEKLLDSTEARNIFMHSFGERYIRLENLRRILQYKAFAYWTASYIAIEITNRKFQYGKDDPTNI